MTDFCLRKPKFDPEKRQDRRIHASFSSETFSSILDGQDRQDGKQYWLGHGVKSRREDKAHCGRSRGCDRIDPGRALERCRVEIALKMATDGSLLYK